jgi:hypothetical protein
VYLLENSSSFSSKFHFITAKRILFPKEYTFEQEIWSHRDKERKAVMYKGKSQGQGRKQCCALIGRLFFSAGL